MSKYLEIRRHTDNDGDVLTDEGVRAAVQIGRELDGHDYQMVVSSGAQRATQTAACVLAGWSEPIPFGCRVEPGIRSEREDRWRELYQQTGSGHLTAFTSADPDFVDAEAKTLGAALRRILEHLQDGGRALVIGHSPTNEAAILGLTGEVVEPLGKGEGVLIESDGERTVLSRLEV